MARAPVLAAITLPVLAYAALCGWMYFRQRDFIYFPQATLSNASEADFVMVRDGARLHGWVVNPGQSRALLYFGGNAERIEDNRDDFARWFPGHSVYFVAYRGYGASEGTPSEQALFADALAFYDLVQAQHPAQPITVIGSSLGSGVASYLASARPVARLALIAPFDNLANVAQTHYPLLPVRALLRERFDSARHLAGFRGPVLVIRAGQDEVIPAASTARLIAALPQAPQVVVLARAGHNTIRDDPAFGAALRDFVN